MIFVCLLSIYFLIGLVCGVVFLLVGYKWMLADAAGSSLTVRLLWFPGAVAIWPFLVLKWSCRCVCQHRKKDHEAGQKVGKQ